MTSDEAIVSAPPPDDPGTRVVAPAPVAASARVPRSLKVLSWLVIVAGVILIVAGATVWFVVRDQLAAEKITVSEDADLFAGDDVDGPLTAFSEADTIRRHALESSDGKTYAELDRDDPVRQTVMTASFLRASLFTSVVSFGVTRYFSPVACFAYPASASGARASASVTWRV